MIGLFFCSCHQAMDSNSKFQVLAEAPSMDQLTIDEELEIEPPRTKQSVKPQERKIITNGNIRMEVANVNASIEKINVLTKRFGGYFSNQNEGHSHYSLHGDFTIRIPSDQLETFIHELRKEAVKIEHSSIQAKDVTEEYLDITTRLKTKKEVYARYIDILKTHAQSIDEILKVERQIGKIQEEIESMEGRLKYLQNKTALSTLTLHIYQKVDYQVEENHFEKPFLSELKDGFVNGWKLIKWMSIGIISIWPIVLILMFLFISRKRIWSRYKNKE